MTASDVFFFPSHEKLGNRHPRLASDQNVVARYSCHGGWLDNRAATLYQRMRNLLCPGMC